jgi:acyl dehydratase
MSHAVLYYEDLVIGTKVTSPLHYEVTREEVIEFALKYDPQPFHLDDDAAAATHFGRLSASGWHTAAMTMRMMVESFTVAAPVASLGSPGIDELRWIKPVYPGDVLTCTIELIEKRRMTSRDDMALSKSRYTITNQHDEPVMTMVGNGLIKVREPAVRTA